METFGADKWSRIGFVNVTAVHFCSLALNQQTFDINLDWSALCSFTAVVMNMKTAPERIEDVRPQFT